MASKRVYGNGVYWYVDAFSLKTGMLGFYVDIPIYFKYLYSISPPYWIDL